jgi:hypothetical protein
VRLGLAFVCAAWLCACSPPGAPADLAGTETAASANQISPDGFGAIHIGAALAEVRQDLGDALAALEAIDDPDACAQAAYTTREASNISKIC